MQGNIFNNISFEPAVGGVETPSQSGLNCAIVEKKQSVRNL